MAMRITCVHQGSELYGSDRSFLETVRGIRAAFPVAEIDVVLPQRGALAPLLEPFATRVVVEPLWVLRRKGLKRLATVGLVRLPMAVLRAWRRLRASDLVYVNTTVVADYSLAARLCPGRTIIHVHEIAGGVARAALRTLVGWSGADIVFNSNASRAAFAPPDGVVNHVVYNGIAGPARIEAKTYDGTRPLRLLMLGRISRIKGQDILVEALSMLPPEKRPEVRIVGNAFEDPDRERGLAARVAALGLGGGVTLMPFAPDPSGHYRWADVVVVPSCLPESLGRVAIEAMAHGRPPLASAIGGLREVVEDGRTGWLVEPGSAPALARTLERIVDRPDSWEGFPAAGRARYEAMFSEGAAAAAIKAAILGLMARRAGAPAGPPCLSAPERAA